MISFSDFKSKLDKIKKEKRISDFQTEFKFPYIYLTIISDLFAEEKTNEECEEEFCKAIELSAVDLRTISKNNLITIQYSLKRKEIKNRGDHWLARLLDIEIEANPILTDSDALKIIHFYGYKGGQGRSTILTSISRILADEHWKVLIIDSDLEAPSIDIIFGKQTGVPNGTLLGYHLGLDGKPISGYNSPHGKGRVDIIPCYPSSKTDEADDRWKSEYISFLLNANSDPNVIKNITSKIKTFSGDYDAIFIDHRTGLSNTPLFWLNYLRGPVAVSVRLDRQWISASKFFSYLFSFNKSFPGLYIQQLTAEKKKEETDERKLQKDYLLDILSSKTQDYEDGTKVNSQDIMGSHFLPWPKDDCFDLTLFPDKTRMKSPLTDAIDSIRTTLELYKDEEEIGNIEKLTRSSNDSGVEDEGIFLEVDAYKTLIQPDNNINFIFGRKGTGKTRIFRELLEKNLAEPLFASNEFDKTYGKSLLTSESLELKNIKKIFEEKKDDPSKFWWALVLSKLNYSENLSLSSELLKIIKENDNDETKIKEQIIDKLKNQIEKKVYLIDGIETAFSSGEIKRYIEGLFDMIQTTQNSYHFNGKLEIKLFLRKDLIPNMQNIEQLTSRRLLYLEWDWHKILNFIVTRICSNEWFLNKSHSNISDNVKKFRNEANKIHNGELLDTIICEKFLLSIFPKKIDKFRTMFINFLKNYFSDSSSDSELLTFYPRVYGNFIYQIQINNSNPKTENIGKKTQISQKVVIEAYEKASKDFFAQGITQELGFLLEFGSNPSKMKDFLDSFRKEGTPFVKTKMVKNLFNKLASKGFQMEEIDTALNKMKDFGIFEELITDQKKWRVGRIFKDSMGMIFLR